MFKASWWKERGYSEEYARQIAKGVRALAREIKLREEDIGGLVLFREEAKRVRDSPFGDPIGKQGPFRRSH